MGTTEHMSAVKKQGTDDVDTEVSRRVVGKTSGGKELVIYRTQQGPWKVKFTSGGELPPYLRGKYTQYEIALVDVQKYLREDTELAKKKPARGSKANAKSKSES